MWMCYSEKKKKMYTPTDAGVNLPIVPVGLYEEEERVTRLPRAPYAILASGHQSFIYPLKENITAKDLEPFLAFGKPGTNKARPPKPKAPM